MVVHVKSVRRAAISCVVLAVAACAFFVGRASAPTNRSSGGETNLANILPGRMVRATLPVVQCPTNEAVQSGTQPEPSTLPEIVPSNLVSNFAVYVDRLGIMRLLAPSGWTCRANYGADGGGGLEILPPGQVDQGQGPYVPSTLSGIIANQTSACVGCALDQACPVFSDAARLQVQDYAFPCPETRPADESVSPQLLATNVLGGADLVYDPPFIAGDANPSGGTDPALAIMTFHPRSNNGSWIETCTLPVSEQRVCFVVLSQFANAYGNL